ncbi:hypothetical protein JCM8208_004255 [Rhodotorula glutinis]
MPPAPGLTFKGPANAKRTSKPVVRLDPVVPRIRSTSSTTANKKRRLSTADRADASRSPDKAARRAAVSEEEKEVPVKKRKQDKGAEGKGDKKAPTKRVKTVEASDQGSSGHRVPYEERVSRDTVAKRWLLLSTSTRTELHERAQSATEDVLEEVFVDKATGKSAQAARKALEAFTDEFDTALAALAVPPLPSTLPQALKGKGKSKDGEIDLGKVLDEKTLRDQLASMQDKLAAAEGDAAELELELEKERRLLKRDRARLAESS